MFAPSNIIGIELSESSVIFSRVANHVQQRSVRPVLMVGFQAQVTRFDQEFDDLSDNWQINSRKKLISSYLVSTSSLVSVQKLINLYEFVS